MPVVFDTSTWISALLFAGVPRKAVQLAGQSARIASSDRILAELTRVLSRKFQFPQERLERAFAPYRAAVLWVTITGEVAGVCRDPNDDHILECARKAGASLIVSSDKDLLTLESFEDIRIVSPRQYIEGVEMAVV